MHSSGVVAQNSSVKMNSQCQNQTPGMVLNFTHFSNAPNGQSTAGGGGDEHESRNYPPSTAHSGGSPIQTSQAVPAGMQTTFKISLVISIATVGGSIGSLNGTEADGRHCICGLISSGRKIDAHHNDTSHSRLRVCGGGPIDHSNTNADFSF